MTCVKECQNKSIARFVHAVDVGRPEFFRFIRFDDLQIISFDQEDGLHVQSMLNLSGDSTVALSSIEIELWNISTPDQWTPIFSSPYLDSVVPYSLPESGMTMWSWQSFVQLNRHRLHMLC